MHYVRTPERNKLLGKSGHRWENNIKMSMKEIVFDNVNCIQLVQNTE
jgi:hypothetical protein